MVFREKFIILFKIVGIFMKFIEFIFENNLVFFYSFINNPIIPKQCKSWLIMTIYPSVYIKTISI